MYLISVKGYENVSVDMLIIKKVMKNVLDGLGLKNMSDLILKEIYGIYEIKGLTKEQIKNY